MELNLFHTTNSSNRESIESKGLLARRPYEHNFCKLAFMATPKGVYGILEGHGVWPGSSLELEKDIWFIDCTGLTLQTDLRLVRQARYIEHDVGPERLRLFKTVNGWID